MGTSVTMLERHYSKLTATLAAGKLALKNHQIDKSSYLVGLLNCGNKITI
jgi:hypothetical protein